MVPVSSVHAVEIVRGTEEPLHAMVNTQHRYGPPRRPFQNQRPPYGMKQQRSSSPSPSSMMHQLICFRCYGLGHLATSFRVAHIEQVLVVGTNFSGITDQEKLQLRADNIRIALRCMLQGILSTQALGCYQAVENSATRADPVLVPQNYPPNTPSVQFEDPCVAPEFSKRPNLPSGAKIYKGSKTKACGSWQF